MLLDDTIQAFFLDQTALDALQGIRWQLVFFTGIFVTVMGFIAVALKRIADELHLANEIKLTELRAEVEDEEEEGTAPGTDAV